MTQLVLTEGDRLTILTQSHIVVCEILEVKFKKLQQQATLTNSVVQVEEIKPPEMTIGESINVERTTDTA